MLINNIRKIPPVPLGIQSTLLQEERRNITLWEAFHHIISIHAPTRGATAKMHNIPYVSLQ